MNKLHVFAFKTPKPSVKNPAHLTKANNAISNSLNRFAWRRSLLIPLALALFGPSPATRADCRQGCDDYNAYLGENALFSNITGFYNTATGYDALYSNTDGYSNMADGAYALSSNATGAYNTASGYKALSSNSTGDYNTATGGLALDNNNGSFNTATGYKALVSNAGGWHNVAIGYSALRNNTHGEDNTAIGNSALYNNNNGGEFTYGDRNTALGRNALWSNIYGDNNIGLGKSAGFNITGDNNIAIGNPGVAGESNRIRIGTVGTQTNTYIAGISGVTVAGGVGVIVDSSGHLGTVVSSERFKHAIKPMDKASEMIFSLKPVTFHYKKELDPDGIPQFGLVAEEVEKVNPALVARDDQGKPYTVRYEAVNAMLLNEFLKAHRKVEAQEHKVQELEKAVTELRTAAARQQQLQATLARLRSALEKQALQLQRVSERVEANRSAPRVVTND